MPPLKLTPLQIKENTARDIKNSTKERIGQLLRQPPNRETTDHFNTQEEQMKGKDSTTLARSIYRATLTAAPKQRDHFNTQEEQIKGKDSTTLARSPRHNTELRQ
jgi:hypothetical protein